MADIYPDHLAEEYKGVEPMFLHSHAGQAIQTVSKEVHTPEDLAGLKLRIPTRTGAWAIEALDATPVSMPVPDLPLALSKGVVDGALIPWEIIPALKIQDQTQFQIEGAGKTRFGSSIFQVSMNKARWDSLPEDVQKAFRDASDRDWLVELGQIWRTVDDRGIKVAVDSGNTHITLTPAVRPSWSRRFELTARIGRHIFYRTPIVTAMN